MKTQHGVTLVELLVALTILALAMTVTVPNLGAALRHAALGRLARTIAAEAHRCRMDAVNRCRNVGLVFACRGGKWSFTPVADGDGDGVSRRDFERGIDAPVRPAVLIDSLCRGASIGLPTGWRIPDPSGRGRLRRTDPLAAGRSDIVSFSPLGDATPATVYLTDNCDRVLAVRIYGATARVRILEWRRGWSKWRRLSL